MNIVDKIFLFSLGFILVGSVLVMYVNYSSSGDNDD